MSRIRVDDSAEYWWSLPCSLLRDSRLSYEARGVACHLLSLGRNWQLRAVALPRVLHDQSRAKGQPPELPAPQPPPSQQSSRRLPYVITSMLLLIEVILWRLN